MGGMYGTEVNMGGYKAIREGGREALRNWKEQGLRE